MNLVPSECEYKIPRNRLTYLKDLYKIYWPRHVLSYYTLKTNIEWIKNDPSLDITVYSSDENWEQHGTFVIVEHSGERCNVFFNTLDPTKYRDLLLNCFKCLPINEHFTLAASVEGVQKIAKEYLDNEGLKCVYSCDTLLYYLPQSESLQLKMEDRIGYRFRKLSIEDASIIDSLWPHRYPGSDIFIQNLIRFNLTFGVYEERSGKLCGWVMQEQIGTIGLLQVEDAYKRQGFGEQLVIRMIVSLANAGMDATATILATNLPSRRLFHKLGFKVIDRVSWNDIAPQKI